jgi:hypothetical protein
MKSIKTIVLGAALMAVFVFSVAAQAAAPRAYYVRADGDDENNNGRSEAAPFKTVNKAVEAAKMGVIKTIIVIGTISVEASISDAGNDEILLTGKADASEAEKAVLSGGFSVSSKVRITHITITKKSLSIGSSALVTLGMGVVIEGVEPDRFSGGGGYGVYTKSISSPILTMTDNAVIRNCASGGIDGTRTVSISGSASIMDNGGYGINGGSVTITGNAVISGNKRGGIIADKINISGNTAVRDNEGHGVSIRSGSGIASVSGSAVISGNNGMGIASSGLQYGTVTISDHAAISNNGGGKDPSDSRKLLGGGISANTVTMNGGKIIDNTVNGGIIVGGTCTINGGEISGNSAKKGGGIYMTAGELTIAGGTIKGNKAEYGAGIYMEKGTATHTGGTITGNEAEFVGGGVYVPLGATFNAKGGTVSDNTAGDGGNNVFRQS